MRSIGFSHVLHFLIDGAVRFGLSPTAFVATRLVRDNFGLVTLTSYLPGKHLFAEKKELKDGTYASVVERIAKKGLRATTARLLPTDPQALTSRQFPVSTTASEVVFEFVRTSLPLPAIDDPERAAVPKEAPPGVVVPRTAAGLPQTVFVPRSCIVAELIVPLPRGMKDQSDGECIVQFHFGRTEIEAEVTVVKTGEVRRCAIKYLSNRPESVAGGTHATGDDLDDGEASDDDSGSWAASGGGGRAAPAGAAARSPSVLLSGLTPAVTEHDLLLLLTIKGAPGVRRIVVPRGPDGRSLPFGKVILHAAEDGEAVAAALNGERVRGGALRALAPGGVDLAAGMMRGLGLGGGGVASGKAGGGSGRR